MTRGADTALADMIGTMEAEGIKPVEPIAQRLASGDLIRFRCDGDGTGRQNGWAILYMDERPAGAFGNYRLGISRKWKSGSDNRLTAEERQTMQREWAQAKQRRQQERERSEMEAALDARDMWAQAVPASTDHPYLARKGMDPTPFRQLAGRLLVPMYDTDGTLQNVQRIDGEGTKRFLRGGRTSGLFILFGTPAARGATTCIGEGVATMHAVHRATGFAAIATFSAKNLLTVSRLWWSLRPDLDYIICGDDDAHLADNVGRRAAQAAADEIGARLAFPTGRS